MDPLTILIGTNASGKSNILDALHFLQKISVGKQINAAINGDTESKGIRGGAEWAISRGAREASLEVIVQSADKKNTEYRYIIKIGLLDEKRIELKYESLQKTVTTPDGDDKINLFNTLGEDLRNPNITAHFNTNEQEVEKQIDFRRSYSVLSQSKSLNLLEDVLVGIEEVIKHLSKIFILDPIPSHMRDYSKLSDTLKGDASNISGVLAALNTPSKNETEGILTKYISRLPEKEIERVWTEPVGKFNSDAMLYCSEKWMDSEEELIVDARGMSDGTLRFLGIMTALLTIDENSLLVIEEIDNGFHPSRANILIQFLKEIGAKRSIDVICTTHNPAFLDALGNEMIVFISVVHRNKESGYSDIKLLEDVAELPRLLARGRIGKLASLGLIEETVKKIVAQ